MPVRDYSSHHSQLFGYQAHDRLPEGHICFLIDDVIEELKLAPATRGNTVLGAPTYEPRMRRSASSGVKSGLSDVPDGLGVVFEKLLEAVSEGEEAGG